MKVSFFSAKNYEDSSKNNGDCILVDTGTELIVYDCGCVEHAKRALLYMRNHGYRQIKVVLSHNDSDHFDGIPFLIDSGVVSEVYTLLLLKYKGELLNRIGDRRMTRDSIAKRIEEIYSNIYSLSGTVDLKDMFVYTHVSSGVTILGPSKEYTLDAVAKRIDSRKSDYIDKETVVNAVSTQLSVEFGRKRLLLTGDSSFEAIKDVVKFHDAIQLPHHGKLSQAEDIFAVKGPSTIYYVSDNTGDSNGGSADLRRKHPRGHIVHNTIDGDQVCSLYSFKESEYVGSYFRGF